MLGSPLFLFADMLLNLTGTAVASSLMDKQGRKKLLMASFSGMVSLLMIANPFFLHNLTLDFKFKWVSFSQALLLISCYNLHMISCLTQEVMSCNWWFQLYWMGNVGGFNAGACIGIIMALIGGLFRHSGSSWNSLVSSAHDHSFLFLVKARGSSCWGTTLTSLWHPAWTCICMPQMRIQLLWESEKKITL